LVCGLQLNEEAFLALWWLSLRGNVDGLTSFWSGHAKKKALLEALAGRRQSTAQDVPTAAPAALPSRVTTDL
jgi:Mg-chelatase subunit ChlI